MLAIEFSMQSLNEIFMMSVRKWSIGVMRWCFFFTPRMLIFPGRRRLSIFSINIDEKYFFAEMGQCFPGRINGNMPVSAKTKRRLSSHKKNLTGLHCKFFMQHQNKKTSSTVKKNIIGQWAFLKRNCAMSTEKYQSGYFTTDVGYWVFYSIP